MKIKVILLSCIVISIIVSSFSVIKAEENKSPVANPDFATVNEFSIVVIDVLANDDDPDGDSLNITDVEDAAYGEILITDLGVRYWADAWTGDDGTDSFNYTINDGMGGTADGTITVTIKSVSDPPVAIPDFVTIDEDSSDNVIDVLSNDIDPDGDSLSISNLGNPSHGSVSTNSESTGGGGAIGISLATLIFYTPDLGYVGEDSFTYTAYDGRGETAEYCTAAVTVTVIPLSEPEDQPPSETEDQPPVANSGGPYYGYVNDSVSFDCSESSDDGVIISYEWNFGDGTIGSGITTTHIYNEEGIFTVTLTVIDNNDQEDSDTTTANITRILDDENNDLDDIILDDYDNDGIPDDSDEDDDNDGLKDETEETLGSNPKNSSDIKNLDTLEGCYLVDTDADNEQYELFYDSTHSIFTNLQINDEGKYLIDTDGDGVWNYVYDPASGELTLYKRKTPGWFPVFIIAVIIVSIAILVVVISRLWLIRMKR